MRKIFLLVLLLLFCQGAHATTKEPFGVPFYPVEDKWASKWEMKFLGEDKKIVDAIEIEVRKKPKADWVTWTNQLANLADVGECAPKAVLKFELLLRLGFSKEDLRLVFGIDSSGIEHAVAAIRTEEGWRVLDNGHLVAGFKAPLDSQIVRFRAERSFN